MVSGSESWLCGAGVSSLVLVCAAFYCCEKRAPDLHLSFANRHHHLHPYPEPQRIIVHPIIPPSTRLLLFIYLFFGIYLHYLPSPPISRPSNFEPHSQNPSTIANLPRLEPPSGGNPREQEQPQCLSPCSCALLFPILFRLTFPRTKTPQAPLDSSNITSIPSLSTHLPDPASYDLWNREARSGTINTSRALFFSHPLNLFFFQPFQSTYSHFSLLTLHSSLSFASTSNITLQTRPRS